jgi:hypothetical protein
MSLRSGSGYPYRNFADNCATRIRDHIFAVLPPEERQALEALSADPADTYLSAVSGYVDAAAASHGGSLSMIPAEIHGSAFEPFVVQRFDELGIRPAVSGSADFMNLLHGMRDSLANDDSPLSMMADGLRPAADGTTARQQLANAFNGFDTELAQTPPNAYLAIYTPARLKAKLIEKGLIAAPEAITPRP